MCFLYIFIQNNLILSVDRQKLCSTLENILSLLRWQRVKTSHKDFFDKIEIFTKMYF